MIWPQQNLLTVKIKMNLYGASGHAKVIRDIIYSLSMEVEYLFDDDPRVKCLDNQPVTNNINDLYSGETIISVGNNRTRKKIAGDFNGRIHAAIAHSSAIISHSVKIMKGTTVMANAVINSGAIIGEHCIINTAAVVEHDCELENFVHISPSAALAGAVKIGEGTHVGIGAVVIPGVRIGKWVTIGAGTVIINDIPDRVVVVGNPGEIVKEKFE